MTKQGEQTANKIICRGQDVGNTSGHKDGGTTNGHIINRVALLTGDEKSIDQDCNRRISFHETIICGQIELMGIPGTTMLLISDDEANNVGLAWMVYIF